MLVLKYQQEHIRRTAEKPEQGQVFLLKYLFFSLFPPANCVHYASIHILLYLSFTSQTQLNRIKC